MNIPRFTSIDTFKITGRGQVYTLKLDRDYPGLKKGTVVIMDGTASVVTGVEAFAICRYYDGYKKGEDIGLMCRDATWDELTAAMRVPTPDPVVVMEHVGKHEGRFSECAYCKIQLANKEKDKVEGQWNA